MVLGTRGTAREQETTAYRLARVYTPLHRFTYRTLQLLELTGAVDVSCIVPQPQRQPASAPVQRSAEADGSGKSTLIGELLGDAGGGAPVGSTDNVKASILFPPPSAPPVPVPVAESPIATFPGTYDAFNAQHGASDDLPDLEDLQL